MSKQSSLLMFTILVVHIGISSVTSLDPAAAAGGGEHVFELYMHDILGGSNPTARPVTGLLGNIYSGQVPFARRIGFRAPQGGVAIPNANGAIPTVNANGVPLGTGLVGTQFAGNLNQNNIQNQIAAQLGPDGLGLGFGTITVIDDLLTIDPHLGSQTLGKAQGVYVSSSADGSRQMMTFTAMMEGGCVWYRFFVGQNRTEQACPMFGVSKCWTDLDTPVHFISLSWTRLSTPSPMGQACTIYVPVLFCPVQSCSVQSSPVCVPNAPLMCRVQEDNIKSIGTEVVKMEKFFIYKHIFCICYLEVRYYFG